MNLQYFIDVLGVYGTGLDVGQIDIPYILGVALLSVFLIDLFRLVGVLFRG